MNRPERDTVSDGFVLTVVGAVAVAVATVWLWGALAGAVFGSGWIRLSAPQLLDVLVRFPSHIGDPEAAWPAAARSALPGAAGFYLTLGALLGLLGAAGWLLHRARLRLQPATGARWATTAELRSLRRGAGSGSHRSSAATRLTLGRHGLRRLYAEQRHAVVAFGPPQSG